MLDRNNSKKYSRYLCLQESGEQISTTSKKPTGYNPAEVKPLSSNPNPKVMDTSDPIQRAGLRLLSARVIPIQTEIRRYLAIKELHDRRWGVIIIQTYFRRWLAELYKRRMLYCAIKIQSVFRGWLVRDILEDQHYCATQIQKIARGFLTSLYLDKLHYYTVFIQSIARRNATLRLASYKYNCVLKIQSLWRGFRYRSELDLLDWQAAKIQAVWRGHSAQYKYLYHRLDIITVQSVVRRRAAMKLLATKINAKQTAAATVIQKYWRRYDQSMVYWNTIADILIVQSVARRWLALRELPMRRLNYYDEKATNIQRVMRGWKDRTHVNRIVAAINIQRCWRGFKSYVEYIFTIADVVNVQRTARRFLARKKFRALKIEQENNAATQIQRIWRGYHAHIDLLSTYLNIIIVQSVARRYLVAKKFKGMLAREKKERRAAINIQTAWRGFYARYSYHYVLYVREYSATQIQKTWRMFALNSVWRYEQYERRAAIKIQAKWRGFVQYSQYIVSVYAAIRIQSVWRRTYYRRRYLDTKSKAIAIQSNVRGFSVRRYCQTERLVNAVMRSAQLSQLSKTSATRIQLWYFERKMYWKEKFAALVIERFFIWVREKIRRELEEMERQDRFKRLMEEKKQNVRREKNSSVSRGGIQNRSNYDDDDDRNEMNVRRSTKPSNSRNSSHSGPILSETKRHSTQPRNTLSSQSSRVSSTNSNMIRHSKTETSSIMAIDSRDMSTRNRPEPARNSMLSSSKKSSQISSSQQPGRGSSSDHLFSIQNSRLPKQHFSGGKDNKDSPFSLPSNLGTKKAPMHNGLVTNTSKNRSPHLPTDTVNYYNHGTHSFSDVSGITPSMSTFNSLSKSRSTITSIQPNRFDTHDDGHPGMKSSPTFRTNNIQEKPRENKSSNRNSTNAHNEKGHYSNSHHNHLSHKSGTRPSSSTISSSSSSSSMKERIDTQRAFSRTNSSIKDIGDTARILYNRRVENSRRR